MQRYLWITHPGESPSDVKEWLTYRKHTFVMRILTINSRVVWAFVTSKKAFNEASTLKYADDSHLWSVTSCNKQYAVEISDDLQPKYAGCMSLVTKSEALAWHAEQSGNWYLRNPETDEIWMPVDRNPNKVIPTGDNDLWPRDPRAPKSG